MKTSKDEMAHWAYQYGTDAEYLEWLSHQPSVICGLWNQYDPKRNIACHVRRLSRGSGAGYKPKYSAVSMTDKQHKIQSAAHGEERVLMLYGITCQSPARWFEEAADRQLREWVESIIHGK